MAEFETTCPHCGTVLAAQDDWIGTIMACPVCQKEFMLQEPCEETPATKPCPFCGNEINAKAIRCKFCKQDLPQTKPCPLCGNEINVKAIRCKFCKQDLLQKGDKPPIQAAHTSRQIPFRKKLLCISAIVVVASIIGGSFYYKRIADEKYIAGEIKKAKDSKTYARGYEILNSLVHKYGSNPNIQEAKILLQEYGEAIRSISFESDNRPKIYLMYPYSEELADKCNFAGNAFEQYHRKEITLENMEKQYQADIWMGNTKGLTAVDIYKFKMEVSENYGKACNFIKDLLSRREWLRMQESDSCCFRFKNVAPGRYICVVYCARTNNFWWKDTTKIDGQFTGLVLR